MRPILGALLMFGTLVSNMDAGPLRAGAARVDITPPPGAALPMGGYGSRTQGFRAIHDNIYVRAIVIDDGDTQAALVAWESLFVPDAVWEETSKQIAADAGIRPENLLLSAVHDHGAPTLNLSETAPKTAVYTRTVEHAAVEAVRLAKSRLQPARFGIGTQFAYVNVNRREAVPGRGLWLGYNEEGPSNKTVTVLR